MSTQSMIFHVLAALLLLIRGWETSGRAAKELQKTETFDLSAFMVVQILVGMAMFVSSIWFGMEVLGLVK